jgi:hypothetical protein
MDAENVEALDEYIQGRFPGGDGARLPENILFFYLPIYCDKYKGRLRWRPYRSTCPLLGLGRD